MDTIPAALLGEMRGLANKALFDLPAPKTHLDALAALALDFIRATIDAELERRKKEESP